MRGNLCYFLAWSTGSCSISQQVHEKGRKCEKKDHVLEQGSMAISSYALLLAVLFPLAINFLLRRNFSAVNYACAVFPGTSFKIWKGQKNLHFTLWIYVRLLEGTWVRLESDSKMLSLFILLITARNSSLIITETYSHSLPRWQRILVYTAYCFILD